MMIRIIIIITKDYEELSMDCLNVENVKTVEYPPRHHLHRLPKDIWISCKRKVHIEYHILMCYAGLGFIHTTRCLCDNVIRKGYTLCSTQDE